MCRIITNLTAVLILLITEIATAGQSIWQDATPGQLHAKSLDSGAHYFSADHVALRNALSLAPHETSEDFSQQIDLPMPDGSLASFTIVESPIMKPALATRYPDIKTFKVYGIDDPVASGRVDITPQGFHAMLFTANGRLFIDPDHTSTQPDQYLSRYRRGQPSQELSCGIHKPDFEDAAGELVTARSAARIPGMLLEYDLAVAATEEYVFALGDTVAKAQAGIVTAINQVNLIYERDLGIRLMLVGNNDQLIESGGNVSFTNDDATVILEQNQAWLDKQLTSAGYDIGHVFGTGVGGAAFLGAACNNSIKAKGTSGQSVPLGNSFYIDYVAHEIGHQFNAEHSFNGTTSSCGLGRVQATAFEPGSGSSVMAYAGICGSENLQMNSDSTFHAASIAQIDSFTKGAGSCYAIPTIPTNNNDPTITPLANRVIPANTPFILDSTAIDNDPMPTLSYQWDQMDAGCPTNSTSFGTDNGSNALFRSYVPRGESWRNFPALGTQVQGRFDKAEVLPCQNRDLDFRLTARDGNSGQDTGDLRVSVTNAAGPFAITNLTAAQTIMSVSGPVTVSWNVANTNLPPINCASVAIDLLTFSDTAPPIMPTDPLRTYSIHPLVASAANVGIAAVNIVPVTKSHPRARIRVKCVNNIFYDISDADLEIVGTDPTPDNFSDTDDAFYFPGNMFITDAVAPACGAVVDCGLSPEKSKKSSDRGSGSGAFDFFWLLMMTGMIAVVKLLRRYSLQ